MAVEGWHGAAGLCFNRRRHRLPINPKGRVTMKQLFALIAVACAGFAVSAHAADVASAPKAKTAQQEKMTTCNAEAKGKAGDERKAFMKECLSAKKGDGKTAQQEKMKTCNADAKGKTGDERKAFMKECLSK
jgi:hypothetical protein